MGPRCYRDFAKNIALLGAKKMGSNMRPRYIQFRDIHDRDISGLHCNQELESILKILKKVENNGMEEICLETLIPGGEVQKYRWLDEPNISRWQQ